MTNQERKEIAKKYYLSISENKVLSSRMSPTVKGYVTLKVYNERMNHTGNITIGINPEYNELLLMSEIGVHGSAKISDYQS